MAEVKLTTRQLEILSLVARGWSYRSIANELELELATVRNHLVMIRSRLEVSSSIDAVFYAIAAGWLTATNISVVDELKKLLDERQRLDEKIGFAMRAVEQLAKQAGSSEASQ